MSAPTPTESTDPAGTSALEEDLGSGVVKYIHVAEWSPEIIAAYELAHLGFYTASPMEVTTHAKRLSEEFGVVSIAELVDYPDKAPASVAGIVTNMRLRTTKKGERMAWLTLADGTAAIEASLFPNAYERLGQSDQAQSSLREGAFVVARGRLAQQEATGSKLLIDELHILSDRRTQLSALQVAIEEQQPDEWSALGR